MDMALNKESRAASFVSCSPPPLVSFYKRSKIGSILLSVPEYDTLSATDKIKYRYLIQPLSLVVDLSHSHLYFDPHKNIFSYCLTLPLISLATNPWVFDFTARFC